MSGAVLRGLSASAETANPPPGSPERPAATAALPRFSPEPLPAETASTQAFSCRMVGAGPLIGQRLNLEALPEYFANPMEASASSGLFKYVVRQKRSAGIAIHRRLSKLDLITPCRFPSSHSNIGALGGIMISLPFQARYSPVSGGDDLETNSPDEPNFRSDQPASANTSSIYRLIMSLLFISVTSVSVGFYIGQNFPRHLDAVCSRHASKYCRSPRGASACVLYVVANKTLSSPNI